MMTTKMWLTQTRQQGSVSDLKDSLSRRAMWELWGLMMFSVVPAWIETRFVVVDLLWIDRVCW